MKINNNQNIPFYLRQIDYRDADRCEYTIDWDGEVIVDGVIKRTIGKISEDKFKVVRLRTTLKSKDIFGSKNNFKIEKSFSINKHVAKFLSKFGGSVEVWVVDGEVVYTLFASEILEHRNGIERQLGPYKRKSDRQIYVPVDKWRTVIYSADEIQRNF